MGAIFNLDNSVWSFMGKVADLVILNIMAIICSIPIFTIGATWTAVYFVTIRIVRKEEGYVIRDFFRSFKENFKQATIIWLIVLMIGAIILADILIYRMMPDKIPQMIMIVAMIFAFLLLETTVYVFPLLSRFHNTIGNTIKNAFILSVANIPYTILFIILLILPFILMDFVIEAAPLILALGLSLPAYISSMMFVRIFRKLEPSPQMEEVEEIKIEE